MSIQTVTFDTYAQAAATVAGSDRAHLMGGGTLLMRAVNEADAGIDTLVTVQQARNAAARVEGDKLVLPASMTMAGILKSRDCAFLHPVARLVGGPAIRNMASVGGNLFAPSPYGDLATALLAMEASVLLASSNQWITLEQLLRDRTHEYTAASSNASVTASLGGSGQVVVEVSCNRPQAPADFRFHKVSRVQPKGISVMALAAHLPGAGGGVMKGVRVAYGAMGPTPQRVPSVERCLEGAVLDETSIAAAVARAADDVSPPTDAIASSWYRQTVAPVHLGRMLRSTGTGN